MLNEVPVKLVGLEKFKDVPVLIQTVPDWEAQKFGANIAGVLQRVGWKPEFADESQTNISALSILPTVHIFTRRRADAAFAFAPPTDSAEDKAFASAQALRKYFSDVGIESVHFPIRPSPNIHNLFGDLPSDTVFVEVGSRSLGSYIMRRKFVEGMPEEQRKWWESQFKKSGE
jgi:hypothetical protein